MKKSIYDENASRNLTLLVRSYFYEKDRMKKNLIWEQVLKQTQILLYLIPQRLHIIPEEYVSEFYLKTAPELPQIIESFRLSNLEYMAYFTQLIKFRARYFMIHTTNEEKEKESILCIDNYIHENTPIYSADNDNGKSVRKAPKLNKNDLLPICLQIINTKPRKQKIKDEEENFIHDFLSSKTNRRGILLILLSSHNQLTKLEIEAFAKVYDCPATLFDNLNIALGLWCTKKLEEEEKYRALAITHWKRLIKFEQILQNTSLPEERKELILLKNRCLKLVNSNNDKIRFQNKGLTINQIADIFFKTPNTISVAICKIKKELKFKLNQLNLSSELAIINGKANNEEEKGEALFCQQQ